jgi:NAD(P)-dependent dehydrogenase (short-subunit alcohol dehydrogenase family)
VDTSSYRDRVCIVTGATRGIGRCVTEQLLADGALVLGVGNRAESCAHLREELASFGDALDVVAVDLREPSAGEQLVARVTERWGRLDVVVNVAASFEYRPGVTPSREDWSDLITLKLLGYNGLIVAAIPELKKTKGAIANVAGTAGITASPESPHVGAVNAAVISMSESYAALLAGAGVRVNVVTPGGVDTDRFTTRVEVYARTNNLSEEEVRAAFSKNIPVGHPADPEEIAATILAVSAPGLRSLTGAHVVVDGAATLSGRRRL